MMALSATGNPMRPRVLVVDDDNLIREIVAETLEMDDYYVIRAAGYQEALDALASRGRIDLLLTDIVMPEHRNGLSLARIARAWQPGIQVVYMTGGNLPEADFQALGPVFHKPIDWSLLMGEIGRIRLKTPAAGAGNAYAY